MNFLIRMLAVDVPENTKLHSWELRFRDLTTGWLIALIALALVLLLGALGVAFFYVLEKGTLGWFRRILLIGLRWTLLLLLVLLLLILILQPILLIEFAGERPQGVALLLDNSESMKQRDRRLTEVDNARVAIAMNLLPLDAPIHTKMPTLPAGTPKDPPRMALVQGVLKHPKLDLLKNLQKFGPLRPYYFGHDLRGLEDDNEDLQKKILAGFKAEESRTALADSILKILQSKDADPPSAIVVITDGQDNASKYTLEKAAEECRLMKVPLHIYGVGTAEGGQLQLRQVGGASGTLFAEDTVTMPVHWRGQGFKKGTAEVTLTLGGKEVAKKAINLQTGDDLRDELVFVVPKGPDKRAANDDKPETQNLVATIKYKSEGVTFEDKLTRSMRVVDSKIRILYIEHSPRWEFKFLQPALVNRFKKRCDVDFILVNAAPEVARGGPPYLPEFYKTRKEFLKANYNLIILGDVASNYLNKEQQEWIRAFVENRGGLIVMAGRQNMPGSYDEKSPIAEMLPIEFKQEKFGLDAEKSTQEYQPTLTVAGKNTDWLALADTPDENLDAWQKKLIGFHWNYPITKLRSAATALIVNPRAKMGDKDMPVLALHRFGKGRVLWLGTDETWRWRWNHQDKYFDRLWGQLIYQMGSTSLLGDGAERTQITLGSSKTIVGVPSMIHVTLLDEKFDPRDDKKVEAELEYVGKPGEKIPVTLNLLSGGRGEYRALIAHQHAGRFELRVKNPEVNTFSFHVDLPPQHELAELGLAEDALRKAAEHSGGRFYREEDLHELVGKLELRKKEFTRRQEVQLWNPWNPWNLLTLSVLASLFVVFVGVITMEWLVRKFSDLS